MKKFMTALLGLSLLTGVVAIADDHHKEGAKKEKKEEKKDHKKEEKKGH